MITRTRRPRLQIGIAFFGFIMVGVGGGSWGVILPSLITYYGVDKATVGIIFFASAIGYMLSASASGFMLTRLGMRLFLLTGVSCSLVGTALLVMHPPFFFIIMTRVLQGLGTGMMETGLNNYVAEQPDNTKLLNYLHAFFGVGSLIGPVVASAMLALNLPWYSVYTVWLALTLLLLPGFALAYRTAGTRKETHASSERSPAGLPRTTVFRMGAVWLAVLFLLLYCGVEAGLGNWIYTYLLEVRQQQELLAGWIVSGYWLGLTLGRFLFGHLADWLRLDKRGQVYGGVGGVIVGLAIIWLIPNGLVAAGGFCLIGFFLGPIYPTTIAMLPDLLPSRMLSHAMGLIIGLSIIGVALFPWIAGALAQNAGTWTLLPYMLLLSAAMLVTWLSVRRSREVEEAN